MWYFISFSVLPT